jgi:potassium efflux system protein
MLRVLSFLALLLSVGAYAQTGTPAVELSQIDAAIELASASLAQDDPLREPLLKTYGEARAALISIEANQSALDAYSQARDNASAEAESIQAGLTIAQQQEPQEVDLSGDEFTLVDLEQMIQVDRAELVALKSRLADVGLEIDGQPGRPAEVRARLSELNKLLAELDSRLGLMNKTVEAGSAEEASLWREQAQFASASMEKAMLDAELLSQPMRLELLKAQQDKAAYDIGLLEIRLVAMEQRAGELRQGEADQARAEAELVAAGTEGKHELVQQLADRNTLFTESFSQRGTAIEAARQQEVETKKLAEQLETDLNSIKRKLDVMGMTIAVGEILREQAVQLPTPRESKKFLAGVTGEITNSSMRQIELEDERRQLRSSTRYIKNLVGKEGESVIAQIGDDLRELVRNRRNLISQAVELEATYAQTLGDLDFTLRRYAEAADKYRDFISRRMLWIPSRETLSLFRGAALPRQLAEVFEPQRWYDVIKVLPQEVMSEPFILVAITLVLILIWYSPRLVARLRATGDKVGYIHTDLYINTIQALVMTAVLSLRWPLLLVTIAWLFEVQEADSELATAVDLALVRAALYFWGLEFMRLLLLPKGLAEVHFLWPPARNKSLRRRIVRFEQTFLPAAFLVVFSISLYPREVGGTIGALAVIAVLLSIAQFFRRMPHFVQGKIDMLFNDQRLKNSNFWAKLIRGLLVWVPLLTIVAVLLGYTYTAIEFSLLLIQTVLLYSVMLLLHEMGLRWLRLTRRRMIVKVRQDQAQSAAEDTEASIEEEELLENDPELLNDEGTKLLNALLVIAGLLLLLPIWAEVIPALGVLDSVELWNRTATIDGREAIIPVTLASIFTALAIAVFGWVALSRIPSLLEILLRQKMRVRAASAYAATQVFRYAATIVLVVTVLGALGGSWSQIQWAVAALSIGIGFGLQEIVANFTSGLIILFEQPIRIGDTVTVGDVSGKVTKIHIRATTIRDFDRRELLVPNKEFITTQLLNWSLSDQVTRRTLQVGVAYGTDMDKAMSIVREVALEHPLVLGDPLSIISFDEFGDNSLLISLRFYLDQLEQRLIVASDLRLEINRRFNAAGIVVAFPQRDIHLDTNGPLEITMVEKGLPG